MHKVLAIETSAEACSVALSADGFSREIFKHAPMRHAELLLPAIHSLLADAGLELSALDAIAFGRGPGSFTSLRIGIGVVQGLAWGARLPVVPVSSLAALAQVAFERTLQQDISGILVAVDARMQEVYSGCFEISPEGLVSAVSEERVCAPEKISADQPGLICGAGNGFDHYPSLLTLGAELAVCLPDCWPRASAVCRLAVSWLERNQALPADQAQPVYIRDKVAEKPKPG